MQSNGLLALGIATALTLALAPSAAAASPEVHLPNLRVGEADAAAPAPLTINVALDRPNPYSVPVSVIVGDFTTRPVPNTTRTYGTATPGADYAPITSFRLSWAPGQQIATFPVTLLGDTLDEAEENINIRISGPSGVMIRDNDIDIVLRDNDPNPLLGPTVLMPNAAITEPDTGCAPYEVTVHLTEPAPAPASAIVGDFTALPVPGTTRTYGTATPGVDYLTFSSFRLRFAAGANAASFPIHLCGDTVPEIEEEIDVRISGPSGLRIADNDLDLVLRNDD
jgi:Calx-beta domain